MSKQSYTVWVGDARGNETILKFRLQSSSYASAKKRANAIILKKLGSSGLKYATVNILPDMISYHPRWGKK